LASASRPGVVLALKEVEALARTHTHLAVATLAEVCMSSDAPSAARVSAASVLLDRGWGRAPQTIVLADATERLSDEALRMRIASRLAALVSGSDLGAQDLVPGEDGTFAVAEIDGTPAD